MGSRVDTVDIDALSEHELRERLRNMQEAAWQLFFKAAQLKAIVPTCGPPRPDPEHLARWSEVEWLLSQIKNAAYSAASHLRGPFGDED